MKKLGMLIIIQLFLISSVFASNITSTSMSQQEEEFKTPWLTGNKTHQYLGLGALALGALTAIAPKPSEDDYKSSLHYQLAMGATYLGGAALGTGLVFHYKDLTWKRMFRNPDNWHALLATIGTAGFIMAVNTAPNLSHTTPGIIGLAGMAAAVKITW